MQSSQPSEVDAHSRPHRHEVDCAGHILPGKVPCLQLVLQDCKHVLARNSKWHKIVSDNAVKENAGAYVQTSICFADIGATLQGGREPTKESVKMAVTVADHLEDETHRAKWRVPQPYEDEEHGQQCRVVFGLFGGIIRADNQALGNIARLKNLPLMSMLRLDL